MDKGSPLVIKNMKRPCGALRGAGPIFEKSYNMAVPMDIPLP